MISRRRAIVTAGPRRTGDGVRYRIGTFKTLTGLSEATLRFYDRQGLLCPARDRGNDYRSYDEYDLLQLVQVMQYSSFDIPLAELPGEERSVTAATMRDVLAARRKNIEATISELYDKLGRIKLHEASFERIAEGRPGIAQANIGGIYRLFLSDPEVARHPSAEGIAARWLSYMPYTHATVRIPLAELRSSGVGPYRSYAGIGMLERYFIERGESFREPMQYSPPNTCIHGVVAVEDLGSISRADLAPFFDHLAAKSLIPVDDMFGWVVYIERDGRRRRYYLSLRIAVA